MRPRAAMHAIKDCAPTPAAEGLLTCWAVSHAGLLGYGRHLCSNRQCSNAPGELAEGQFCCIYSMKRRHNSKLQSSSVHLATLGMAASAFASVTSRSVHMASN